MNARTLLLLAVFCIGGNLPPAQGGQPSSDQQAIRQRIDELNERIATDERELKSIRKDRNTAQAEAQRLGQTIARRRRLVQEINTQTRLLQRELGELDHRTTDLGREVERQRAAYRTMVRDAWRNYRHHNVLTYLFSSATVNDATRRLAAVRYVGAYRQQKVRQIDSLTRRLGVEMSALSLRKASLDSTRVVYDGELRKLARDETRYRTTLGRLSTREKKVVEAKLRRQQELERIVEELRRAGMKSAVGGSIKEHLGRLPNPVPKGRIKANNSDIAEIVGERGTAARAVFDGEVMQVSHNTTAGMYFVIIAHGDYATSYSNLATVQVKKGDRVRQNQSIGTIAQGVDLSTGKREYKLVFGLFAPRQTLNASKCILP